MPPPKWSANWSLETGKRKESGFSAVCNKSLSSGARKTDAAAFEDFVRVNFAGDQATLDTMFNRLEHLLEQLGGHMHEINREFCQQLDLDLGPVLPFDEVIGGYDPSAHVLGDFFQNKLAFVVLLNFPLTTLDERLKEGPTWSRRQWAEARLAQGFSKRIPADVSLGIAQAEAQSGHYIAEYNIWMHTCSMRVACGCSRPRCAC